MSTYTEFFLNSSSSVVQLELLQMSHPSWSQTYYVVRNAVNGITVTLETGVQQFFQYYPMAIKYEGMKDDLDQTFSITFGDLGTVVPDEVDNMIADDTMDVKPTVIYRCYRSDDLTTPMLAPYYLEIQNMSFNTDGVTFNAQAPQLNITTTGSEYTTDRFPTLLEFL